MLGLSTNRQVGLFVAVAGLAAAAALRAADEPEQQPAREAAAPQRAEARQAIAREQRDTAAGIRRALQREVTRTFTDTPLQDALGELADEAGVPLWIDARALSEEGISLDEPVSAMLQDAGVEAALERILSRFGLAWHIEDEVLKVTTATESDEELFTKVYNVSELLRLAEVAERELSGADLDADGLTTPVQFDAGPGWGHPPRMEMYAMGMGLPGRSSDWLLEILMDMTSGAWEKIDGVGGTAEILEGALVLRQTQRVHDEAVGLIEALTRAARGELQHGSAVVPPPGSAAEKRQRIQAALAKKGTAEFRDETLRSALASLGRQFEIPVVINEVALTEEGVSLDEPVTLRVRDVTLGSMLNLILRPLGLTTLVRFGVLEVTTETEAWEHLETVVYDIADLARSGPGVDDLVDAIQSVVSGEWEDVDGVGGAISVPFPGALVIRQTQATHGGVELLLSDVRRTLRRGERNGTAAPKQARDPQQVTTQFYRIDLMAPIGEVTKAIPEFVAGELDGGPDELKITTIGGTLMIRTTNRAHDAVRVFLRKLQESEAFPDESMGGGSFGEMGGGLGGGAGGSGMGSGFFSTTPPQPSSRQ